MQAGAVNDVVTINLVQSDGVTPYATTGYSSAQVVIRPPTSLTTYNIATTGTTPILTVNTNSVVFKTIATTFPTAGTYLLQVLVTFPDGTITKSRMLTLIILESLV